MSATNEKEDCGEILVVDDEPMLRLVLVDLLEDEGYVVYEAADASAALAMLGDHTAICVVVTDVQMPGTMDGLALASYIRDSYPPIGLIIASGAVNPRSQDLPEAAVFLSKPIDTNVLSGHVQRFAEQFRA